MAIVRVRGALKQMAGGASEHTIEAATVVGLLRELERAQPGVSGWILDERGHIRSHINVFVNGDQSTEATPVGPGDRIDILPAISGG
jgi:molybdopterin converting factor small subunit